MSHLMGISCIPSGGLLTQYWIGSSMAFCQMGEYVPLRTSVPKNLLAGYPFIHQVIHEFLKMT
jgi:hypothetical protein